MESDAASRSFASPFFDNDDHTRDHYHNYDPLLSPMPMDPSRPQAFRPFASLLAADALLNLSASPYSPFATPAYTHGTPHFASPGDLIKDHGLITPLQGLFSSPSQYWNLTNSISPILRTSSPGAQHRDSPSEPSSPQRGRRLSRSGIAPNTRSLSAIAGLSPLSDVSTLSSDAAASLPETTPSAPSSSAPSQAPTRKHPSPIITKDDWEAPIRRYGTRARTKAAPALSSSAQPNPSSLSPEVSARKRVKRPRVDTPQSARPAKKARQSHNPEVLDAAEQQPASYPRRTFPKHVPFEEQFALIYRRFPVCSYTRHGKRGSGLGGAVWNKPRSALDLYTPRFVKGRGTAKVGVCPICCESVNRGGENRKLWLSMKFSAFKCYHMMNMHGISSTSGLPFSPPVEFRITARDNVGKNEKTHIQQGKCHKCKKWVAVEGIKDVETKVKEIFWWKHAASCHRSSNISGETDVFVDDDVYKSALAGELDDDEDEEAEEA